MRSGSLRLKRNDLPNHIISEVVGPVSTHLTVERLLEMRVEVQKFLKTTAIQMTHAWDCVLSQLDSRGVLGLLSNFSFRARQVSKFRSFLTNTHFFSFTGLVFTSRDIRQLVLRVAVPLVRL